MTSPVGQQSRFSEWLVVYDDGKMEEEVKDLELAPLPQNLPAPMTAPPPHAYVLPQEMPVAGATQTEEEESDECCCSIFLIKTKSE